MPSPHAAVPAASPPRPFPHPPRPFPRPPRPLPYPPRPFPYPPVIEAFVEKHEWAHFLCEEPASRSNTSVCLTLDLPAEHVTKLTKLLEKEQVALDINAYRTAPPGLRIWCGSTIEAADLAVMCEWLAWGYETMKAEM